MTEATNKGLFISHLQDINRVDLQFSRIEMVSQFT